MTRSLQAMQPWIAQDKLHPEIGHILPMAQAGEAHRLLLQRENYGKIVLEIGQIRSSAETSVSF